VHGNARPEANKPKKGVGQVMFTFALHFVLALMLQQYMIMHRNKIAQRGEQKLWTKTYTRQYTETKPNKGKRGEEL
jgi:hypothetical protein